MTEYKNLAAESISGLTEVANRQVRGGRVAAGILADPIIDGFFAERTKTIAALLLEVDTQDEKATSAAVLALQALHALHGHLTQAVTSGLAAAQRLNEQANEGEAK